MSGQTDSCIGHVVCVEELFSVCFGCQFDILELVVPRIHPMLRFVFVGDDRDHCPPLHPQTVFVNVVQLHVFIDAFDHDA